MLRDLRAQVVEVDVAELVARDHHDAHAREHGAGRVRAVRALRDEADRARVVAVREVVAADREQARELALAARVRLEADGVVARDVGEPGLQLEDELEVALDVVRRGEGWMAWNSGQVTASISVAALSFMVQEPSGIMPRSSA